MIKDAQFIGYISVLDDNGDPVTGLIDAAFSKVVAIGGAVRALAVVVSEIGSGLYSFTVTPDLIGECNIRISHTTYGNWRESFEVSEYSVDDVYSAVTSIVFALTCGCAQGFVLRHLREKMDSPRKSSAKKSRSFLAPAT